MGLLLTQEKYLILGVISGLTTFIQQKISSPAGQDQSQNTFLYIMPIFIGYVTYNFKAGLGLYWVANNVMGIAQQLIVTRFFLPREEEKDQTKKKIDTPQGIKKDKSERKPLPRKD